MRTLRFIIAGFGFMGQTHAGSICKTPGMELAAIVDSLNKDEISPKGGNIKTEQVPWEKLEQVPFFKTLEEALAKVEADAVLVATPNFLHCRDILTALDAGKDVFSEKPLCATLEEAYRIREKLARTNAILQVGFVVRFGQPYRYLRETLESGRLGKLKFLHLTRYTGAPAWWSGVDEQAKLDTALQDLNVHDIDFAMSLLGEPEKVHLDQDLHQQFNTSLFASTWSFAGGVPVQIQGGFLRPSTVPFRSGYMAMFERGMLEFTKNFDHSSLYLHTPEESCPIDLDPMENPYFDELLDFRDNVLARRESDCNVHAAIRDMEWIERLLGLL